PTSKSDRRYGGRNIYDLTKLVDYLDTMGPSVAEQVKKPRHKKQYGRHCRPAKRQTASFPFILNGVSH
ncbi:hypothetical protein ACSLOL_28790, partial [Escherichia coli]